MRTRKSLATTLILLGAALLAFSYFVLVSRSGVRTIVGNYFIDDTFYYLKIAQHVAGGTGFTFDGLNLTNGFQPLWLFICTTFFMVLPGRVAPMVATIIVSGLLHVLAGLLLYRVCRPLLGQRWALFGAIFYLLNPSIIHLSLLGMETGVLACTFLFFVILLQRLSNVRNMRWQQLFLVGFSAGLVALSRVEYSTIIILAVLYIGWLNTTNRRRFFWGLGSLIGGFGLILLPYLLWNYYQFHALVPVSGFIKSLYAARSRLNAPAMLSWAGFKLYGGQFLVIAHQQFAIFFYPWALGLTRLVYYPHYQLLFGALIGLSVVAGLIPSIWRTAVTSNRVLFGLLTLYVGLHFLLITVLGYYVASYDIWHYAVEYLWLAVIVTYFLKVGWTLIKKIVPLSPVASRSIKGVFGLLLVVVVWRVVAPLKERLLYPYETASTLRFYDAGQWIDQHVEPTARVGTFSSGIIGYFARQDVVNLDGLVNSYEYYQGMKDATNGQLLARQQIGYVADYFTYDPGTDGIGWVQLKPGQLVNVAQWPMANPDDGTYYVSRIVQ